MLSYIWGIQESGLTEVISLMCTSALWGQSCPSPPESPRGVPLTGAGSLLEAGHPDSTPDSPRARSSCAVVAQWPRLVTDVAGSPLYSRVSAPPPLPLCSFCGFDLRPGIHRS